MFNSKEVFFYYNEGNKRTFISTGGITGFCCSEMYVIPKMSQSEILRHSQKALHDPTAPSTGAKRTALATSQCALGLTQK